ncbi:ABC transporter permease [soil metagenome]
MWKITFKGLLSRKRRLIATSTAVVLGVAFLAATLALGDTMRSGFDGLFTEANAGTGVVVRNRTEIGADDLSDRGTLDEALVDDIATVDGVDNAVPVFEGTGQIVAADGGDLGGDGPPAVATNWIDDPELNPYRLFDGRLPEPRAPGASREDPYEVVIDRGSANNGELAIGDRTAVKVPEPVDVEIVGLATFGSADSLGPSTYTAFSTEDAEALLSGPERVTSIRVSVEDGISQSELQRAVGAELPDQAEALTGAELTSEQMDGIQSDFLGMFEMILLAFAGVALLVASFSIHNTFSILVAQRTRESALLRAIGASRRQVLTSVVVEALAVGVVASGIGLAAGFGLAAGLKALMASFGIDLPVDGVILATDTVLVSVAVGVLVALLASVTPAVKASRVAPLAALQEVAVDRTATSRLRAVAGLLAAATGIVITVTATSTPDGALARAGLGALVTVIGAVVLGPVVARPAAAIIGAPVAMLRGQTGRLARRNAMRNPRRTAASASALMVGTAVVALFTTVGSSITASIEDTVDKNFGGDLVIMQESFSGAPIAPQATAAIDELPEVSSAVGLEQAVATVDGADVTPMATDPAKLEAIYNVDVSAGALTDVTPGRLAVSEKYADDHDLEVGSVLPMRFADGDSTELAVAAVYELRDTVGDLLMSGDDWAPHATQPGNVAVLIDLADGVDETTGEAAVATVADRFGTPEVQTRNEYIDSVGGEVEEMLTFVYALLGVAILIALMGIANTLSLSIHERTRELGLLRAVGQTRRQVRSAVRWESVIVAVFGTIGGLGVGTFLGWGLIRAIAAEEGFGVFDAPIMSLAMVLALAALAGVVAAVRPARRAGLDILGAISSE